MDSIDKTNHDTEQTQAAIRDAITDGIEQQGRRERPRTVPDLNRDLVLTAQ